MDKAEQAIFVETVPNSDEHPLVDFTQKDIVLRSEKSRNYS